MTSLVSRVLGTVVLSVCLVGCATTNERVLDSNQSQVALRSIQARAFDTPDVEKTLRTSIATLQDLGFVVDKADLELGTVSGTKLNRYQLKMTIVVKSKGDKQVIVRANAQYKLEPVSDPEPYQAFFRSLEKAMFLTAMQVD